MSPGFLYRRLSKFIPCVFQNVGTGGLSLRGKFEISSFRDVFMSSNYWRMFDHLKEAPKLVVDLGAHCGHFTALCHTCVLERFGVDHANYILIEALPKLLPGIRRTVFEIGIEKQTKVIQGVVGKKNGVAYFQSNEKNLLASKASSERLIESDKQLAYVDLDTILPSNQHIDVLKIDIEGSEYELFRNYRDLFRRAKLLLIETHGEIGQRSEFQKELESVGLTLLSKPIERETESLLLFGSMA